MILVEIIYDKKFEDEMMKSRKVCPSKADSLSKLINRKIEHQVVQILKRSSNIFSLYCHSNFCDENFYHINS